MEGLRDALTHCLQTREMNDGLDVMRVEDTIERAGITNVCLIKRDGGSGDVLDPLHRHA